MVSTVWFFFLRTEGKNFNPDNHLHYEFDQNEIGVTLDDVEEIGPVDALRAALEAARRLGLPRGSHRSGCFQVQCSFGIFRETNETRFDLDGAKGQSRVEFRTWDQMESEPLTGDDNGE